MARITEKLLVIVKKFAEEENKFNSGNNSAGTRARKALQELKRAAGEGRERIQAARTTDNNTDDGKPLIASGSAASPQTDESDDQEDDSKEAA